MTTDDGPQTTDPLIEQITNNLLSGLGPAEIAAALGLEPETVRDIAAEVLVGWQDEGLDETILNARRLQRGINSLWDGVQAGDPESISLLAKLVGEMQKITPPADDPRSAFKNPVTLPGQVESRAAYRQLEETAGEAIWFEDYLRLRNETDEAGKARWDWRKAVYIAWAALPGHMRWPKTQGLLATQILGLSSDRSIRTWRMKDPGIDDRVAQMTGEMVFRFRASTLWALGSVASMADPRAHSDRKMLLEMTGDYHNTMRLGGEPGGAPIPFKQDFSDYDEDELDHLIINLQTAIHLLALGEAETADEADGADPGPADLDPDQAP